MFLNSLFARLLLLAAAILLPVIALQVWEEQHNRQTRREEGLAEIERLAAGVAGEIRLAIESVERVAATLALTVRIRDPERCGPLLEGVQKSQSGEFELGVAHADGSIYCSAVTLPPEGIRLESPTFREAVERNRFAVGGYAKGPSSGRPYLTLYQPLRDEAGAVIGAIVAGLDLDRLAARIRGRFPALDGTISAVDRNGTYVLHLSQSDLVGTKAPESNGRYADRVGKGAFELTSADGTRAIAAIAPVAVGGSEPALLVTAGVREAALFRDASAAARRAAAVIAFGLAAALLVAALLGRWMLHPLTALVAAVGRLREGERGARVEPGGAVELRRLGALFNDMAARVETREAERDAALARLKESEEELRLAIETTALGLWQYDIDADVLAWDARTKALFGLPPEAAVSYADFVAGLHPEDRDRVLAAYAAALDASGSGRLAFEHRTVGLADGVERWLLARGRVEFDSARRPIRVTGTVLDITARKHAEEAVRRANELLEEGVAERTRALEFTVAQLRRSEERYAAVFQNSGAALFVVAVSEDGRFVYEEANDAFFALSGHTEATLIGRTPEEALPAALADTVIEKYRACLESGRRYEYELAGPIGGKYAARRVVLTPVKDATGRVTKLFGSALDITGARRLEEQLRQSLKMEAVGQLTGGVAHDFNNLLTAVLGNLELAQRRTTDAAVTKLLDNAVRAGERGAALTRQLLAFARRQNIAPKPLDLNELVGGMNDMLQRTLGPLIRVETHLAADAWPALADRNQLELALLNLAVNARDAMSGGGRLVLETANVADASEEKPETLGTGDFVVLAVRDNGEGMDEATLARAFEPFFTTKEVGKGSGLGLSQVYGLVEHLGGVVTIESAPGRGTTVRLYLPRAAAVAADAAAAPRVAAAAAATPRQQVILADDDPAVREVIATFLREAGWVVHEAASGMAALELLDRMPAAEALVLDHAMPGMTGVEAGRVARQRRPGLPVLIVTGFADKLSIDAEEGISLLRKPFRQIELSQALQRAIDGHAPGAKIVPFRSRS